MGVTCACRYWASQLTAAGAPQLACMFKRAAHLAMQSVSRWQNPAGYLQVVKNRFDPADRWGYEVYSFQSNYNLLPAAMLATAAQLADESVEECAAPADVGGFVFEAPEFRCGAARRRGEWARPQRRALCAQQGVCGRRGALRRD